MSSMKRIVSCFFTTITLAGCGRDFGMPLESGEVVIFENGHEVTREPLSPDQMRMLAAWFEQHRSGWHGLVAPASAEPAQLQLSMKHTDGKYTSVSAIARPSGGHYLRLTSSEEWAYRSFGGVFKSWAAALQVPEQDFETLQNLLRRHPDQGVAPGRSQ
jgi:hypothetical protein